MHKQKKEMTLRMAPSPMILKKCEEAIRTVGAGYHPMHPPKKTFRISIQCEEATRSPKIEGTLQTTKSAPALQPVGQSNVLKSPDENVFQSTASHPFTFKKQAEADKSQLSSGQSATPLKSFPFTFKKTETGVPSSVSKTEPKVDLIKQFRFKLKQPGLVSPKSEYNNGFGATKSEVFVGKKGGRFASPPSPIRIEQLCVSCISKKNSMPSVMTQVEPLGSRTIGVQVDMTGDSLVTAIRLEQERKKRLIDEERKRKEIEEERMKLEEQLQRELEEANRRKKEAEEFERKRRELEEERRQWELEQERHRKELEAERREWEERGKKELEDQRRRWTLEEERMRKELEEERRRRELEETRRRELEESRQPSLGRRSWEGETYSSRDNYRESLSSSSKPMGSLADILESTLRGNTSDTSFASPPKIARADPQSTYSPKLPQPPTPAMQPIHAQLQAIYAHAFGNSSTTSGSNSSSVPARDSFLSSREKLSNTMLQREPFQSSRDKLSNTPAQQEPFAASREKFSNTTSQDTFLTSREKLNKLLGRKNI